MNDSVELCGLTQSGVTVTPQMLISFQLTTHPEVVYSSCTTVIYLQFCSTLSLHVH